MNAFPLFALSDQMALYLHHTYYNTSFLNALQRFKAFRFRFSVKNPKKF